MKVSIWPTQNVKEQLTRIRSDFMVLPELMRVHGISAVKIWFRDPVKDTRMLNITETRRKIRSSRHLHHVVVLRRFKWNFRRQTLAGEMLGAEYTKGCDRLAPLET